MFSVYGRQLNFFFSDHENCMLNYYMKYLILDGVGWTETRSYNGNLYKSLVILDLSGTTNIVTGRYNSLLVIVKIAPHFCKIRQVIWSIQPTLLHV